MVKNKYKLDKNMLNTKPKYNKTISSIIGQNEFEGLIGFEEIKTCKLLKKTKYGDLKKTEIADGKIIKKKKKKPKKKNKDRVKQEKSDEVNTDEKMEVNETVAETETIYPDKILVTKEKKIKKKKQKKVKFAPEGIIDINDKEIVNKVKDKSAGKPKRKNNDGINKKAKKARYDSQISLEPKESGLSVASLGVWRDLFVPEPVLKSLAKLGFSQPTEIQRLSLPPAIKGRKDIIGAAETGSGKTLAFGIPVIEGILRDIELEKQKTCDSGVESDLEHNEESEDMLEVDMEDIENSENDNNSDNEVNNSNNEDSNSNDNDNSDNDDDSMDSDEDETMEVEGGGFGTIGCVKVIDNANFDFLNEENPIVNNVNVKPLRALIIAPTRELAIQVKTHLDAVLEFTSLKTAVVVGGVAMEKQQRLLRRNPEIVIGTPGRLWELVQFGNPHLQNIDKIKYLVIDETDRMVEKGHFKELENLLEIINSNEKYKAKRQNFVYSATLTLVHSGSKRVQSIKKGYKLTSQLKIEKLAKIIGLKPKPKVIDLTKSFGTAQTLTEARISCENEEKDIYLYYFLKQYPGRTLVFCNSIDCVRRLQNLFTMLKCQPQSLHASMHQKQRLKSLERFTSNPTALLLATDVAARGLDIPGIQHVIHYQVPRTAESYVHRSGRTARAYQEGLSILMIDPGETSKYRQLCATLKRDSELPPFPTDIDLMKQVRKRVNLAREVEKMEYSMRKQKVEENWWIKAAQEAELILEDEDVDEEYDGSINSKAARAKNDLKVKRLMLNNLLSKSFIPVQFSGRYPTQTGNLVVPFHNQNDKQENGSTDKSVALSLMKKEKETFSNLVSKVKIKPTVQKVKKSKKTKGFEKRKLKMKAEKEKYKKEMAKNKD